MPKFDKQSRDTFKWRFTDGTTVTGYLNAPRIKPVNGVRPENLFPFNEALKCKHPENHWVHFYIDDYQFERIWNNPQRYLPILKRFKGVISTDFSIYLDMPRAQQIWNCWRNACITYWLQENGVIVIPNVGWSDAESLSWSFDAYPNHSVLAVTSQGCFRRSNDRICMQSFVNGLHELIRQKNPEKIYVYGLFPDSWQERFPVEIIAIPPFAKERMGA